jgi:hypothetical protein
MKALSVDGFGLLNFFEVVPVERDLDIDWIYNESAYELTRGQIQISFTIAPAYRDVRIVLKVDGSVVYELNATGIDDVTIRNDNGREWLEIRISQRHYIALRMKPEISVSESLDELR